MPIKAPEDDVIEPAIPTPCRSKRPEPAASAGPLGNPGDGESKRLKVSPADSPELTLDGSKKPENPTRATKPTIFFRGGLTLRQAGVGLPFLFHLF